LRHGAFDDLRLQLDQFAESVQSLSAQFISLVHDRFNLLWQWKFRLLDWGRRKWKTQQLPCLVFKVMCDFLTIGLCSGVPDGAVYGRGKSKLARRNKATAGDATQFEVSSFAAGNDSRLHDGRTPKDGRCECNPLWRSWLNTNGALNGHGSEVTGVY
jgi:hypothetical protein